MPNTEKQSALSILKKSDRLPTLPAVALKILEVARKEDVTVSEMEKVIGADPPLAAKVLSIVNSPFYSLPRKVTSVRQAISLLGVDSVKNLALGFSLVRGNRKGHGFDYPGFWKKSLIGAVSCRLFAQKGMGVQAEESFFLGLLQDIGVLALAQCFPTQYTEVLEVKRRKQLSLDAAEREVFGFDHAEAGSLLAEQWRLPPAFCVPIRHHHEPDMLKDPVFQPATRLLAVSAAVVDFFSDEQPLTALERIKAGCSVLGASGDIEQNMIRVFSEAVQLGSIFDMDLSHEKSYDEILEEANRELGRNSLHLQKTLMEQMRLTEDLKEQVSRDGLTGLHNHRCFHELLERELDRALRYKRPLSLIFCDFDHFKRVNDSHGHQMGDEVLVSVAKLFERTLRKSDFVARYGGEEFAILLVETPVRDALEMAERLRKLASELPVACAGACCRVTISFGVTGLDPERPVVLSKEEIIRHADEALYEAKRTGRNKTCVSIPVPGRVGAVPAQDESQAGWRS